MDAQSGIAAADLQSAANRECAQRTIDQQMRAAVEAQILKVDSRGR